MAFVLPNVSKIQWLERVLADGSTWVVKLHTNVLTIGNATVIGDFTEATFAGYSSFSPTYGAISIDGSNRAAATAAAHTFHLTAGSQVIRGYYIVDAGGDLLGGENFGSPVTLDTSVPDLNLTITTLQTTL